MHAGPGAHTLKKLISRNSRFVFVAYRLKNAFRFDSVVPRPRHVVGRDDGDGVGGGDAGGGG